MLRRDLRELFAELPDARVQRTRRHRLTDILVTVLMGTILGCEGWDEISGERVGERERDGARAVRDGREVERDNGDPGASESPRAARSDGEHRRDGVPKGIAKQIVAKGADYLFGLKGNQPTLHEEVKTSFDAATCSALSKEPSSYCEMADKGHGRNELRRVYVQREVSWLVQSEAWPKLSALILVESERTRRGEKSIERRAHITSSTASAQVLAEQVRGHWHVENRLIGRSMWCTARTARASRGRTAPRT